MEMLRPWIELVLPQPCYTKVIEEQDFLNGDCIATAVSKLLGYAIILGSVLVKLPQIIKILAAKSGEGLSVVSLALELVSYTAAAAYGFRNQFPFSAYGENIFLMVQSILITLLVLHYGQRYAESLLGLLIVAVTSYLLFSGVAPFNVVVALQTLSLPIMASSKFIQIVTNYSNGSTGQLSFVTVALLFSGSLTRILTSMKETGDRLLILNFAVASLCNGILFAQILYYWKSGSGKTSGSDRESKVKAN